MSRLQTRATTRARKIRPQSLRHPLSHTPLAAQADPDTRRRLQYIEKMRFWDGICSYCVAVLMPFLRPIAVPLTPPRICQELGNMQRRQQIAVLPPVSLSSLFSFRWIDSVFLLGSPHCSICSPQPFHITTLRHATSIFHTQTKNNCRIRSFWPIIRAA